MKHTKSTPALSEAEVNTEQTQRTPRVTLLSITPFFMMACMCCCCNMC